MKYLLISALLLTSIGVYGQTEKVCFITHHYKCHFCGMTYKTQVVDAKHIKNEKIRANYEDPKDILLAAVLDDMDNHYKAIKNSECNGSQNGKHTWIEETDKATKTYKMVKINQYGGNEEIN